MTANFELRRVRSSDSMMHHIGLAQTDAEICRCFPVMQELRPHLLASEFVERVRRQQQQGYQLLYLTPGFDSSVPDVLLDAAASDVLVPGSSVSDSGRTEPQPKAVAGFRLSECLSSGRFLYVDDLVTTAAERSCGYGEALLNWLIDYARQQQCQSFQLDSGVQRFAAHRFYFRQRLAITCYRFEKSL
jgi:GNAT superfamily N-acetyltransferase